MFLILLPFVIWIFLFFYGLESWFFIDEVTGCSLLFVSFLICICLAWKVFVAPETYEYYKLRRKAPPNKPLAIIGILIIFPFLIFVPIGSGIPSVITKFLPPNETLITKVKRSKSKRTKGCDHQISFEGISSMLRPFICDKNLVSKYKAGDIVRLEIRRSRLGVRIYSVADK